MTSPPPPSTSLAFNFHLPVDFSSFFALARFVLVWFGLVRWFGLVWFWFWFSLLYFDYSFFFDFFVARVECLDTGDVVEAFEGASNLKTLHRYTPQMHVERDTDIAATVTATTCKHE